MARPKRGDRFEFDLTLFLSHLVGSFCVRRVVPSGECTTRTETCQDTAEVTISRVGDILPFCEAGCQNFLAARFLPHKFDNEIPPPKNRSNPNRKNCDQHKLPAAAATKTTNSPKHGQEQDRPTSPPPPPQHHNHLHSVHHCSPLVDPYLRFIDNCNDKCYRSH